MGNACSQCHVKDGTIAHLSKELRLAQQALRTLKRAELEAHDLKIGLQTYLHNVGRHGLGASGHVIAMAARSALEHHAVPIALTAAAIGGLWHVGFRAHIARLSRQTVLSQPLGVLLESDRYSDVEIRFRGGGRPLLAHRCILTATSPYFSSLFQFREAAGSYIRAEVDATDAAADAADGREFVEVDESRADIERYLEFLYTGTVRGDAEELWMLADRLSDPRCQLACTQQIVALRGENREWWQFVVGAMVAGCGALALSARFTRASL